MLYELVLVRTVQACVWKNNATFFREYVHHLEFAFEASETGEKLFKFLVSAVYFFLTSFLTEVRKLNSKNKHIFKSFLQLFKC